MSYPLCLHIKTNGFRCQAPALTGRDWCYFHARLHQCHRSIRRQPAGSAPAHLRSLPPLEDRESIQIAISAVFASLAAGHIDSRQAYALFYGLQLAAANSSLLRLKPGFRETQVLAYATTSDGIPLAADSRNPEPLPEPDPEPIPEPLHAHAALLPTSTTPAPRQPPPPTPQNPPLIRSCVADRLKVRSPYNFREDLRARDPARK
jgi:hypothetical protein